MERQEVPRHESEDDMQLDSAVPQKNLKLRRYFNGNAEQVFDKIAESVTALKADNNVTNIFDELGEPVPITGDVELKVVYKDDKDGQKLEYSIRWPVTSAKRKAL